MSKLRGQGYDGASNMKGELNGLKTKILNKFNASILVNSSILVNTIAKGIEGVAKRIEGVTIFFNNASILVNTIGSSFSIIIMFEAVVEGLQWIKDDTNQDNFGEANQDIVNAKALVEVCKQRLQSLRDDDFGDLPDDVQKFCEEHDTVVPNMEDLHFVPRKLKRKAPRFTNFHYYCVDLYFQVLDMQLKELNDHFNEVNTELLLCMACLNPVNNFASFDKEKIVRLAQLDPQDFDRMDLMNLPIQLHNYIHDMKMHSEFSSLRGIGDLAKKLVKTGRCASYMLVYKLLTLALVLLVATASVEKAFSAIKIVKTPLRNKMGDQ
ncbi:uncharacterized protein LOC103927923 [Pyrus x bretschneideri]|uniref:uncharacterized protein LOC103927923 n=1 Tax=Pyrus x bretschneideri TaxID=225117 RepID=UPI00202E4172|nr:uncharacterized protein LOC103927923 [Pyrus x bretschneideri]